MWSRQAGSIRDLANHDEEAGYYPRKWESWKCFKAGSWGKHETWNWKEAE